MPKPLLPLTFAAVQYHPNQGTVAVLCEPPKPFGGFFVNLNEADLEAAAGGGNWGNDEILALASAKVAEEHTEIDFMCQFPEPPAPSIEEPPQVPETPA